MNAKQLKDFHSETVVAAKQSFIMSFMVEVMEHKYNTVDLVMSALSTRLDELRAEEHEAEAKADHFSEEQFNHE